MLPGLCTVLYCVFQVARSLGILDEVNRMKVVPGVSPSSSVTNKNVRYMEVNTTSAQSGSKSRIRVCSGSSLDPVPIWIWIQVGSGSSVFTCTLVSLEYLVCLQLRGRLHKAP